jgi:Predicted ATPase with chaperone activity
MTLSPELEKLALTVAVGGHSLLLTGSPGTGKSMFLSRIISILPDMSAKTQLEALRIHSSSSQKISQELLLGRPPLRIPHHQGTVAAILGIPEQAGELSLAHGGVLFLDELAEYRRDLLEGLREPLESGQVRVVRARAKTVWKAKMILLAASNLCPCGWFGSQKKSCRCRLQNILNYRRKLSGPILDRIDLHVNLFEQTREEEFFLRSKKNKNASISESLAKKVATAKNFSKQRNKRWKVINNSD